MLLVNFIGEPGAGKTTATAGLFYALKTSGYNVEIVTEYSKELLIAGDLATLGDELQVFAEKYRRIHRLRNVDIVLSDSPLINSIVYGGDQFGDEGPAFYRRVADQFDSIYIIVRRVVPYVAFGRMPDEDGARAAGSKIIDYLDGMEVPRIKVDGDESALAKIVEFVREQAGLRSIRPGMPAAALTPRS